MALAVGRARCAAESAVEMEQRLGIFGIEPVGAAENGPRVGEARAGHLPSRRAIGSRGPSRSALRPIWASARWRGLRRPRRRRNRPRPIRPRQASSSPADRRDVPRRACARSPLHRHRRASRPGSGGVGRAASPPRRRRPIGVTSTGPIGRRSAPRVRYGELLLGEIAAEILVERGEIAERGRARRRSPGGPWQIRRDSGQAGLRAPGRRSGNG